MLGNVNEFAQYQHKLAADWIALSQERKSETLLAGFMSLPPQHIHLQSWFFVSNFWVSVKPWIIFFIESSLFKDYVSQSTER